MNSTAHASYAFLIYALVAWLAWEFIPPGLVIFLVMICGLCPDFDGLYWTLVKRGKMDGDFQHHLYFWTHWPLSYLPLVGLFVGSLLVGSYPMYFAVPVVGVYSHMVFDSIGCGDGLMWGKIPWKKDQYARYVNLWSRHTDGYHGGYWAARYRHTIYFKLETLAAVAAIALIIMFSTRTGFDFWSFLSIGLLVALVLVGFKPVDAAFQQEPPKGRYTDYHVHPAYVAWYEGKYGCSPPRKYASASPSALVSSTTPE